MIKVFKPSRFLSAIIIVIGITAVLSLPFLAGWWRLERLELPDGTDTTAEATIRTEGEPFHIGDPVIYEIVVRARPAIRLGEPVAPKVTPEGTEVEQSPLRLSAVQRILGGVRRVFRCEIQFFDTGEFTLDGASLTYQDEQGDRSLDLNTVKVTVQSLLPEGDEEPAVKDVKPPVGLPFDWRTIILLALGLLVLGILVYLLIRLLRRTRRGGTPGEETVKPQEPAHVLAFRELEELRESHWFTEELAEPFFVRLSGCIRVYFSRRFGIRAPELTTEEFLAVIAGAEEVPSAARPVTAELSALWDRVKFARHLPPREVMEQALSSAGRLVEITREPEPISDDAEREAIS